MSRLVLLNYKYPISLIICLILISISSLLSGYLLDPTFLGLIFTPILIISLVLASVVFTLIPVSRLLDKNKRNSETGKILLICAIAWGAMLIPNNRLDDLGAKIRLSKYSKQDYEEIFTLVNSSYQRYCNGEECFSRSDEGYKLFLENLKKNHEIFNISSFPVDVFIREDYVAIEWGSGLTGGYELVVLSTEKLPYSQGNQELVYLYDKVAFYYKD